MKQIINQSNKKAAFTPLEKKPYPLDVVKKRGDGLKSHPSFLTGFTIVELLTVMSIIVILISLLVPALNMVRKYAWEVKQKAQFHSIDAAIELFNTEFSGYPDSSERGTEPSGQPYCGAMKLCEAIMGRDLMGFHPDSTFRSDLKDASGIDDLYPDDLNPETPEGIENLKKRKGPYLDVATANAFRLGRTAGHDGLFENNILSPKRLDADTFVICDVFGIKNITLAKGDVVRAGTPILYYRANTSSKTMFDDHGDPDKQQIYNYEDNAPLLSLGKLPNPKPTDPATWHSLYKYPGKFYNEGPKGEEDYKIIDPRISTPWPHRPDSYILISAGADGEYGTSDDILNF